MNLENCLFLAKNLKKVVFFLFVSAFFLAATDYSTTISLAEKLTYLLAIFAIIIAGVLLIRIYDEIIREYEKKLVNVIIQETKRVAAYCRWCAILHEHRN